LQDCTRMHGQQNIKFRNCTGMVSGHDQGVSYDVNVQYSTHPQKGSVISLCFQNCFYPNTFNSSVYTVAMERSLPDGRDDGV